MHWHFNKTLHQFLSRVPIPNVELLIVTIGNDLENSYHRIPLMHSDKYPVLDLSILDLTQKLTFCWLWARETSNNLISLKSQCSLGITFCKQTESSSFPSAIRNLPGDFGDKLGIVQKNIQGVGIFLFFFFWREKIRSCLNLALRF